MAAYAYPSLGPLKMTFAAGIMGLALLTIGGGFMFHFSPSLQTPALVASVRAVLYSIEAAGGSLGLMAGAGGARTDYIKDESKAIGHSIPVLVYHGVVSKYDGSDINLSEKQFKEQLFALHAQGYRTITLEELAKFERGEWVPDFKAFMITFDDGRRDSYYGADPVLAALDYSAVMFTIVAYNQGNVPQGYYLSAPELRRMEESGRWEIGSHSFDGHGDHATSERGDEDHFFASRLWKPDQNRVETIEEYEARVDRDLSKAKTDIETIIGKPVDTFAFPYGDFGQNKDDSDMTEALLRVVNKYYPLTFYQDAPGEYYTQAYSTPDDAHPFVIKRLHPHPDWSGDDLVRELDKGYAKPLPYRATLTEDEGWVAAWGDSSFSGGVLNLHAGLDQNGASVVLDGTRHWKNYEVNAEIESPNKTGFALFLRFQNDDNNALCNFGPDFTHIEQTINGEKRVIKGVRSTESAIPDGIFTATARISGRSIECLIDGTVIVETEFLDESLEDGGTGIKIWDPTTLRAQLKVHSLNVSSID